MRRLPLRLTARLRHASVSVRTRGAASAFVALLGLTACAAPPAPKPPSPPPRLALAAPTRSQPAAQITPPMEESDLKDAPSFDTTPAVVAAIRALAPETPGQPPPALPTPAPNEPESLLTHISASTPPNVAAALRLTEEGRQALDRARYDQALDRFERSVAIDPMNAYGYYFLAQLHYRTKKYDQAIAFASRATGLGSRMDRSWLARCYGLQGAVFEEVGRYADARRAYERAITADPDNAAARVGMSRLNPKDSR